jgi:hypothetical protein
VLYDEPEKIRKFELAKSQRHVAVNDRTNTMNSVWTVLHINILQDDNYGQENEERFLVYTSGRHQGTKMQLKM